MKKGSVILLISAVAFCFLWMQGCRKNKDKVATTPLALTIPAGFPNPILFQNNELTVEGFELGRRLFYDTRLSIDGSIACASCHQQIAGFGTYDHDLSHGIGGEHGNRNASPLFNLAWANTFAWDGRYTKLQDVFAAHITNRIELGETINGVVTKLKNTSIYKPLFKAAYGTEDINEEKLLNALAQFVGSLVSAETKYDSIKQNLASFTANELAGYAVFKNKCNSCHTEPLFTDYSYRNIGLPANLLLNDKGRMGFTNNRNDSLKFRVPSLRNLYKSFPFMHDGRFVAFSQVFDHYQTGVQVSFTLDPLLNNGIALSTSEKTVLLEFLKTLTDNNFTKNPAYSAPQ